MLFLMILGRFPENFSFGIFFTLQHDYRSNTIHLPSPSPVLATFIHCSILTYDVPRTKDVGLPTKFRFNAGRASQPIDGSMPANRVRRWLNPTPTLTQRIILHQRLQQRLAANQC